MWPSASVLSCSESDGNDRGVRITDRGIIFWMPGCSRSGGDRMRERRRAIRWRRLGEPPSPRGVAGHGGGAAVAARAGGRGGTSPIRGPALTPRAYAPPSLSGGRSRLAAVPCGVSRRPVGH